MNRRQKKSLQKKLLRQSLKRKTDTTLSRELSTEFGECNACDYMQVCMERRGRCTNFTNYEVVKRKVSDEIEKLNRAGGKHSQTE